jgi:hypothetical protein
METGHRWNHVTYAVAPDNLPLLETAIDALFPWVKVTRRADLLVYRFGQDPHAAALYLHPVPAAAAFEEAVRRARALDAGLSSALGRLECIDADWGPHCGFLVPTVAEWEERVARVTRIERDHPELRVTLVDVVRPGDGRSAGDDLHQAYIRFGLLGPLANTIEMQARA